MRALVILCCCLLVLPSWAEETTVYKRVRPDGTVEFGDVQVPESEAVQLQQLPTYKAQPLPKAAPKQEPVPPAAVAYKSISIASPAQDSTVFFDEGGLPVTVSLEPALMKDHVVTLYLDGQRVASGPSTAFTLKDVFRGSHTVSAAVENGAREELLRSSAVTFNLIQHARNPNPASNPGKH